MHLRPYGFGCVLKEPTFKWVASLTAWLSKRSRETGLNYQDLFVFEPLMAWVFTKGPMLDWFEANFVGFYCSEGGWV